MSGAESERKYYIGLDIGGTKCAVCLGKTDGEKIEILAREETATESGPVKTLEKLASAAEEMLKTRPAAVGVSCGGPLDSRGGVILTPPNLPGWHGFEIVRYIREKYKTEAYLQNDANACALAEWKFGAGRGANNMIFLTFGTGLGAGLILNGRLYAGANDNAGEAGHIRLAKSGPEGFGKKGSFEGFCSGGGIARLAAEMARRQRELPPCIREMGGCDKITTKELSRAAFCGDKFAKKVFEKSGEMLGRGLSILIDVLNPEKIVLGGVFMRSGELLIPAMKREIGKEALRESARVCKIVSAGLKENIGDYAALAVAGGLQ